MFVLAFTVSSFSTSSHKRIRIQNSQHTKWIMMDDLVRKMRQMSKPVRVNLGSGHSLPIGIGSKSLSFDSFVLAQTVEKIITSLIGWAILEWSPIKNPGWQFLWQRKPAIKIDDWPLKMMIFHCHVNYCVTLYDSLGQAISKPCYCAVHTKIAPIAGLQNHPSQYLRKKNQAWWISPLTRTKHPVDEKIC